MTSRTRVKGVFFSTKYIKVPSTEKPAIKQTCYTFHQTSMEDQIIKLYNTKTGRTNTTKNIRSHVKKIFNSNENSGQKIKLRLKHQNSCMLTRPSPE